MIRTLALFAALCAASPSQQFGVFFPLGSVVSSITWGGEPALVILTSPSNPFLVQFIERSEPYIRLDVIAFGLMESRPCVTRSLLTVPFDIAYWDMSSGPRWFPPESQRAPWLWTGGTYFDFACSPVRSMMGFAPYPRATSWSFTYWLGHCATHPYPERSAVVVRVRVR